jgi:hypothetical protein
MRLEDFLLGVALGVCYVLLFFAGFLIGFSLTRLILS